MYRNVCILVLLFLNFGIILGEPKADNVKDYCYAAERDVPSNSKGADLCVDHHSDTCCQDLRQLICSCKDGSSSEGSDYGGKQTRKTRDNDFLFYIFLAFYVLRGVIGAIGELISTVFSILSWIFWFVRIIFTAASSVVRVFLG